MLEAALRSFGHETVAVDGGEKAWQEFKHHPVRLVVCDWKMPGIDGLELCRRLRATEDPYVYFILLTGVPASERNQVTATDAGVDDFLCKPINPHELARRLHVAERILAHTQPPRPRTVPQPICSYCHKVRDDRNVWLQTDQQARAQEDATYSHVVCPQCYETQVRPQLNAFGADAPYPLSNRPKIVA
ncbi:MAG: response regulator [Opitutae bacterium]|nr:response regulator [Opitutae bacterium]